MSGFFDDAGAHLHEHLLQQRELRKGRKVPAQGDLLIPVQIQVHLPDDPMELPDGHFVQVADVLPAILVGAEPQGQALLLIRQTLDQVLVSADEGLLGEQHMHPGNADDVAHVDAGGMIVGREVDIDPAAGLQDPQRLPDGPLGVIDMLHEVIHNDHIEGIGLNRQIQGITQNEGEPVLEAQLPGEGLGLLLIVGDDVRSHHFLGADGQEVQALAGCAAAHIQHGLTGKDVLRRIFGREAFHGFAAPLVLPLGIAHFTFVLKVERMLHSRKELVHGLEQFDTETHFLFSC